MVTDGICRLHSSGRQSAQPFASKSIFKGRSKILHQNFTLVIHMASWRFTHFKGLIKFYYFITFFFTLKDSLRPGNQHWPIVSIEFDDQMAIWIVHGRELHQNSVASLLSPLKGVCLCGSSNLVLFWFCYRFWRCSK